MTPNQQGSPMPKKPATSLFIRRAFGPALALLITTASCAFADPAAGAAGETRVARWQDDKAACFLLMFDDSWPSAWQVAVPELVKRGMIGTFYICPGKGEYKKFAKKWEEEVWKQGMVYG